MNKDLAIKIFNAGIPIFGEFDFKLHEKYRAPKFLMKFNLRKPPSGNLTDELILEIGQALATFACERRLNFDRICGLPRAGKPLAEAFIEKTGSAVQSLIFLSKADLGDGKRMIMPEVTGIYKTWDKVLPVDDVISLADTKIEAIDALRENDLVVTDCICLMDWELGGKEILSDYGVKLNAVYTITNLLSLWRRDGLLSREQCAAIISRKNEIKEFIEQNKPIASSA